MKHWAYDSFFYHIYTLGFCGAPQLNNRSLAPQNRLPEVSKWIEHFKYLGVNAVYFGPVFESATHGYDTIDYYNIDRRLGTNEDFAETAKLLHKNGIKIILDGVFNHVGRDFWAFRDVLTNGPQSAFCSWFKGLSFSGKSPFNDPFTYEGWNGHYSLVKLNLSNPDVRNHLFGAVEMWINEFEIDGLRLDAADCLDKNFIKELAKFCKKIKPDFWLMGEIIHGDYREWANNEMLDSVTNYEAYKGLYSSHADKNYFEIAYTFNREFGAKGLYNTIPLYNFADNHDVNRVVSNLKDKSNLFPLYCLLFTMPGVPSLYYGSEWGIEGMRSEKSDLPLRPFISLDSMNSNNPNPELIQTISKLSGIRKKLKSLRYGNYSQVLVKSQQFAFMREYEEEKALIIVNSAEAETNVELTVPNIHTGIFKDVISGKEYAVQNGKIHIDKLKPNSGSVLLWKS